MPKGRPIPPTIRLAITAVFTALVCAATMVFSIWVPRTNGFFNLGEIMVYTAALLFGPLVGAFAGGVGSMFADLFLGYPHFALATLVIKACEGGLVGFLSRRRFSLGSKLRWRLFTLAVGLIAGGLLSIIGSLYYSGAVEIYLGIPPPVNPTVVLAVPPLFWYVFGAIVVFLISLMGFVSDPEFGWLVLSSLLGGLVMVTGYFLYEQVFLGVAAIAEVPINIGQMTVGLIVAIPIATTIRRILPYLKEIK
jgi:uncharacterized membrane protein